jgi:tetratricopeptide (TPR) repeat protein
MQTLRQVVQLAAAGVVIAAGIPLAVNEYRQMSAAGEAADRARRAAARAEAAAQSGDLALAVRAWSDAVAAGPEQPAYRLGLAAAQARQILDDDAVVDARTAVRLQASLEDAIERGAGTEQHLLALGRLHLARGQRDAARRRFDQVLSTQPRHARALLYLGDLQFKSDELENAQTTLRKAVEADPTLTLAKFALGQVYAARGAWDDAAPLLETAARDLPRNAQAALAYGRALVIRQSWSDAQKFLERALALEPELAAAHGPLGDAYLNLRRVEAAVAAYRLSWEKARDLDSFKKLGRIYVQVGALDAAATIFNQIRDLAPQEPEPHMILGLAAHSAGRTDEARAAWARCTELGAANEAWAKIGEKCAELASRSVSAPGPAAKAPRK